MNVAELNELDEVTRIEIEGYRTGTYVRIEVRDVPYEMVENFNPCHPILVGGLALGEENVGYMQVRNCAESYVFFFPNIYMKCNDPFGCFPSFLLFTRITDIFISEGTTEAA